MNALSPESAAKAGNVERGEGGARFGQRRWVRRLRHALLCLIGLLYAASIPWYRGASPPARIFGLPDWVAVAILCYAAAAILNAAAWLLTDIPDSVGEDEAKRP
jgi:hypothetical protein